MMYTYTQCIFKHLCTYLGCEKPFHIHLKYSIGIALHEGSVQGLYRLHSAHALICTVRFQTDSNMVIIFSHFSNVPNV